MTQAPPAVAPLTPEIEAQILARASRADYQRWADQVDRCGACARPVRLKGRVIEHGPAGPFTRYTTSTEPDGVLLKRCGNRRASVCPSCSHEYAGDIWQLLAAGLSGGRKGIPEEVAEHPKNFASFTAPGFGPVHTSPADKNGRRARCRPRTKQTLCAHGKPTWCMKIHGDDDPYLGEPLCGDCYDYTAAAAFNWTCPELWRRFTIELPRTLARLTGLSQAEFARLVSVQYAKVAEFQRRGVIHFHAIIRLDGRGDHHPAPGIDIAPELLADAVRAAAAHIAVTVDVPGRGGLLMRFGDQVDAVPLLRRADLDAGTVSAEQVAAYVAKYATKAAEDLGLGERRQVPDLYHARLRNLSGHVLRILEAAWDLGEHPDFHGIRRWLHTLGFRGHFSTKSRKYSTTLGAIRRERHDFRIAEQQRQAPADVVDPSRDHDQDDEDTTLVIAHWEFAGVGYLNNGERALAAAAAARARERHELAAEYRRTGVA